MMWIAAHRGKTQSCRWDFSSHQEIDVGSGCRAAGLGTSLMLSWNMHPGTEIRTQSFGHGEVL